MFVHATNAAAVIHLVVAQHSNMDHIATSFKKIAIAVVLLFGISVLGEKFEKTTKCVYTSVEGVETFEFVCEPNRPSRDYFKDFGAIACESESGYLFYKERRHEIKFRNCYRQQLPTIFTWYKALRSLNVSSLGLESLRAKDFDYARNLVTLIVSHNEIVDIPSSLFADAIKLSVVDMSYNKIKRVDPLAFGANKQITLLNLSHNLIVEIDSRTLAPLIALEVLDLSWNRIANITAGLFDELGQLRELKLANNLLQQLECTLFNSLTNLKMLDLNRNQLTTFDANCVENATSIALSIEENQLNYLVLTRNVSEINVAANNLSNIIIDGDLENMTVFNTSKNYISNILEVIQLLNSSLRILDMSDSTIGKLNISTFERFDNLERLSLRNTQLSNIQYGTFHHQQNLRFMDLSVNYLNQINFQMLHWNSAKLEVFYLDSNNLDDFSNLTAANYPSLQSVSIDGNKIDCDHLSAIQRQWKQDGISIVFNPHVTPQVVTTDTHVNGIACYHNSELSKLVISDKEYVEGAEKFSADTTASIGLEPVSMVKVESLLICIFLVLMCLLAISVLKNVVPMFQRNNEIRDQRPSIEEMSLI